MASFSVLTAFWIIKTSQVKERSKEENRVKKTEDSSCLPSHFWCTTRSPFSTYYIPFQISGSQESNALNRVRFGAKMRKIWPSEDNCTMHVRISHKLGLLCEICTCLVQLSSEGHIFLISAPNRTRFEALDS